MLQSNKPGLQYRYPVLKELDQSDREIIRKYTEKYNRFSCEFSFTSLFLWHDIYRYQLSFYNDWLIVFDTRNDYILMPMGEGITPEGLLSLSNRLKQDGYSGDISNVPPQFIERYPELGHYYEVENERSLSEYIYSVEKLVELKGKKLRKKKNHISQFLKNYPEYQIRPMDSAVRNHCLMLAEKRLSENRVVSNSIREEGVVLKKAFKYFESISLEGIAIYINSGSQNQLAGFAVYSRLNRDVFTINFEKINYAYPGAAQIINWETAKQLKHRCRYINREQDLGVPGLRKAKLSYDPELLYPAYFLNAP